MGGVIPAPEHGTFHKVTGAAGDRSIGITICTIACWIMMVIFFHAFDDILEYGEYLEHAVATDFPNLVLNTITAPVLVFSTWRWEPHQVKIVEQSRLIMRCSRCFLHRRRA